MSHTSPGSASYHYHNGQMIVDVMFEDLPKQLQALCQSGPVKVVGKTDTGYLLQCTLCPEPRNQITLCGARVSNWEIHTGRTKHKLAMSSTGSDPSSHGSSASASIFSGEAMAPQVIVQELNNLEKDPSDEEIAAPSNSQEASESASRWISTEDDGGIEAGPGAVESTWDAGSLAGLPAPLPMGFYTKTAVGQKGSPSFIQSIIPDEFADDARPYAGVPYAGVPYAGVTVSDGQLSTASSLETGYSVPTTAGEWSVTALQTATEPSNTGQTDADGSVSDTISSLADGSVLNESISSSSPYIYTVDDANRVDNNSVQAASQPQLSATLSGSTIHHPEFHGDHSMERDSSEPDLCSSSRASESTFEPSYTNQTSISEMVDIHDRTAFTRYKTPLITRWDECHHHFRHWLNNNPTFTSAIRQYSGSEETFYFASVRHGDAHRCDNIVLRSPASFQAVAVEFFNQTNDPLLSRAVWGHGRLTRDESMPFFYSAFEVTKSSHNGVNFDVITAPDANSWLPEHHQVKLTLEYNLSNPNVNFRDLIDILSPFMDRSYQNLLVDYVYAVLAALYKLSPNERKIYLEHQRTYLNGWIRLDWSCLEEANIHTYPETTLPIYEVYQEALKLIFNLLKAMAKSVDSCELYPTQEQISAARRLGSYMSFSSIATARVTVLYGPHVQVAFMNQIKPHRELLKKAAYPDLIPNYMRTEYRIYARKAHLAHLYNVGEFPELPSGDVRIFFLLISLECEG
ncbi:hypothetical protein MVEN_00065000 [Mycena venus]|uniref:Uncharacterized protein n=1 Tax=Mycena venus TaxID=2733690 RepID=A0A8H6Z797_9AGAR|nr:hypothetical protein MVEN_00065000 [Mycena venus]